MFKGNKWPVGCAGEKDQWQIHQFIYMGIRSTPRKASWRLYRKKPIHQYIFKGNKIDSESGRIGVMEKMRQQSVHQSHQFMFQGKRIDPESGRLEVLEEKAGGRFTSTLVIKQILQQDFGTYEVGGLNRKCFLLYSLPNFFCYFQWFIYVCV